MINVTLWVGWFGEISTNLESVSGEETRNQVHTHLTDLWQYQPIRDENYDVTWASTNQRGVVSLHEDRLLSWDESLHIASCGVSTSNQSITANQSQPITDQILPVSRLSSPEFLCCVSCWLRISSRTCWLLSSQSSSWSRASVRGAP